MRINRPHDLGFESMCRSTIIPCVSLVLLCGCAGQSTQRPTIPERSKITAVVMGEISTPVTQAGSGVPTNEEEGRQKGLAGGIAYGFMPWTWIAGGPFTMGPLASAGMASCGAEISNTGAISKLNEIVTSAGVDGFRNGLKTEIQKILLPKRGAVASGVTETEGEYVLEISKLAFSLEAKISDNFKGCGKPHFSVEVHWRLKRPVDNQIIDERTVFCSSSKSKETLPTWLSDKEQTRLNPY